MIAGFDPRYQFIHSDDVVRALEFAIEHDLPGIYNVAPDGVLALSEVICAAGQAGAAGAASVGHGSSPPRRSSGSGLRLSPEMILQLRYGRGLDNRRFKAAGFAYDHSTRETVLRFGEHLRLGSVLSGVTEPYRYEKEVEDFLRWSPSVRNRDPANGQPGGAGRKLSAAPAP